jgi:type III pantothenate kinase
VTLLIDVGNSAVKWARLAADGSLSAGGRALHRGGLDVTAALSDAWGAAPAPRRAVGCSVANAAVVAAVERAARAAGLAEIEWMRSQSSFRGEVALVNGYLDPQQLGADRWHALLGACARLPGTSLVVVNAGTATTVDCVRAGEGSPRFVGGCIAPGVRLMLDSLARGTAGLPLATGAPADFPDTTDKAIVTGVLDAQAGLVERVRDRFSAGIGHAPRLLFAGGHAELLAARLPGELAPLIEHNLVLRGLALRAAVPR